MRSIGNNRIRYKLKGLSQPSYYFGNSLIRLFLFKAVQSFLLFRRRGPSRAVLAPLRASKGTKRGTVALVLGNGPSLAKLNIADITRSKPDIFVVNGFYATKAAHLLKPTYYCLSDPASFFDNGGIPQSISDTFKYVKNAQSTLLISHFYRRVKFPLRNKVIFFNDREFSSFSRNINPCRPRGYSSQTVMKALAVAVYMGYERIYVLGIDNTECKSLFGDADNNLLVRTNSYYADSDLEHSNLKVLTPSGADAAFAQYATWFSDFKKFSNGCIFNLDSESIVDAFPKVSRISG
jgi:hypothetical protein